MDFEGLRSFLAVAQKKSISKAAQHLHVTQPTLSTRLRKMEEGLGFPLLERNWEGVKLTKQGYYFLPYAIQLLQDMNNASTVLSDYLGENMTSFEEVTKNTDRLLIGIDHWLLPVFIKPILAVLANQYPDLKYKFITRPSQTVQDLLTYEGLHLGVFYNMETKHDLQTIHLINDEMVLLYCANEEIQIDESLSNIHLLGNDSFVLFDNPVLTYHSRITQAIIQLLDIEQFHIVDDLNVMLGIISTGNGYTIVPKSAIFQYSHQSSFPIKMIPLGNTIPKINIQVAHSNPQAFSGPLNTLIDKLSIYAGEEYA